MGQRIQINLEGPDGESFNLLHLAREHAGYLGKDADEIQREMTWGDRGYLVEVFRRHFGDYVTLLNVPRRRKARAAVTAQARGRRISV
jgi:hypothetical protein